MLKTMGGAVDWFYRALEAVMVVCMTVMFVLVLGNVIMRFGFNDSIEISEELPRFMFVWLIFLGAVVAMRDGSHIGVTMFVERMPMFARRLCWALCQILIFICSSCLLYSTWIQHEILETTISPVLGVSDLFVCGVSYVTGTAISLFTLSNLARLLLGKVSDDELFHSAAESAVGKEG